MKLTRLDIEGLRGIPKGWPSVMLSDKGLIVYGPNGSGKSSIIDGLEFALGKESSLYPEARQGVDWDRGGPNIKGGPPQARLICQHKGQEVDLASPGTSAQEIASWKRAAQSATYVLRRHMLLKFILSRPADRYGSLESFFNLGAYTALEGKLESLKNTAARLETSLQTHLAAKSQTARVSLGLSDSEAVTSEAAAAKLTTVLAEAGLGGVASESERATRKGEVEDELRGLVTDERLTRLTVLKDHLTGFVTTSTYGPLVDQLLEFQNALLKAREQSTSTAPIELLRAAQTLIAEKQMTECPVCEQDIDTTETVASLEMRINSDVKVSNAKSSLDQQRQTVLVALSSQLDAFRKLELLWGKTMGGELSKPYQDEIALLLDLVGRLKTEETISDLPDVATSLRSTVASHQPLIDAVDAELATAGGARRAVLSRILEVMNVIDNQLAALESAKRQFAAAVKTRAQLGSGLIRATI